MERDRWTLTVEFDPLETQQRADPDLAFPRDECSRVIAHLLKKWGLLPEELQETAEWTSTRLTVTSDVLDPLAVALGFITMHTVPTAVRLIRDSERG